MPHHGPLIATIVTALVLAFALGVLAHRLKISPLVGYLLAGVMVGPFTPGFVADQHLAAELAEIGVILLMFGVGLHFSVEDLLSVRRIAIPGAIVQITMATALGLSLALWLGWSVAAGLVFGLALSVASTVVLLRALQARHILTTERGRIAVGWLIVEDLAMVLALVLVPALAGAPDGTSDGPGVLVAVATTMGKVAAFAALMLIVGRRAIPWILHHVAHTGSRELFRLAVLACALGVAYGAALLFDVSFALGAFFAGMILSESPLSQRAAEESLPLRDAFAVLFFVSVGMLFDPGILVEHPWLLLATLFIILIGKTAAALAIVRALGYSMATALTIAASLAQIGEFSFILAGLGVALGLLPEVGQDLVLAGALLSILLNPLVFALSDRLGPKLDGPGAERPADDTTKERDLVATRQSNHTILVGYGRVGSLIGTELKRSGHPFVVIEERPEIAEAEDPRGVEFLVGNAADADVLQAANLAGATRLLVCIPESFDAGQIVAQARQARPDLTIVARAHSDGEVEHLTKYGADIVIMGEREIARRIVEILRSSTPAASG